MQKQPKTTVPPVRHLISMHLPLCPIEKIKNLVMSCYLVVSKLCYTALNTTRYTRNHCPNPPAMRQFRMALPDFVANRDT